MSYSRWPLYAWSDGCTMHLWVRKPAEKRVCVMQRDPDDYDIEGGVNIDEKLFDQLALCVVAQMAAEPKRMRRAVRAIGRKTGPFRGNGGSYDLMRALGRDPVAEFKTLLATDA